MDHVVKYFVFLLLICPSACGYNYTTCYIKRVNITNEYPVEENGTNYPEGIDCVWEICTTSQFGLKVSLNGTASVGGTNEIRFHNETGSPSFLIFEQNPSDQNESIKESSRLFYTSDEEEEKDHSTFVSRGNNLWIVFTTSLSSSSSSSVYNYSMNDTNFLQSFPIFYQAVPLGQCEYPNHLKTENRNEIVFVPVGSQRVITCYLGLDGAFTAVNLTISCILGELNVPVWNDSLSNCQEKPSIVDWSPAENNEHNLDQSQEKIDELFSGDIPTPECGLEFEDDKGNVSMDEKFPEKTTCNFTIEVKNSDELELFIHNYSSNSHGELLVFGNDGFVEHSYNLSQIKDFPKEFDLKTKKISFTFLIPDNGNLQITLTYSGKNKTECHSLKPPVNGYLSTGETSLGTDVKFFCDDKYHLDGPNGSKCEVSDLGNATWTNSIPNCLCIGSLLITEPTSIPMSELIFPTKDIKQNCIWNITTPEQQPYNVYLEYTNNSAIEINYVLTIKEKNAIYIYRSETLNSSLNLIHTIISNNAEFKFELNGPLSTKLSQIRVIFEINKDVCPYPSFDNGKVSLHQHELGTDAIFTCNPGYEMIGEDKTTCVFKNDSKVYEWSRDSPLCIRSDCSGQANDRNATAGIIVSPGTPAGYKGDLNCTWNIHYSNDTDRQRTIEISVHYFNLSNCLLIVGVNSDGSEILIKKICDNSETPVNFTSQLKQISLRYVGSTNDTLGYNGFSVGYHVISTAPLPPLPTTIVIVTQPPPTTTTTATQPPPPPTTTTTTTQATTTTATTTLATTTTQATTTTEAATQATTTTTQAPTTTTQPPTTTTQPPTTTTLPPTTTTLPPTTTTQLTTTTTQPTTTTTQPPTTTTQATTTTTTTQATPPPPQPSPKSPQDEHKITIIVPLVTPSGGRDKANKYDTGKTVSSSQTVVGYTQQKSTSTPQVKSTKKNGGKNYSAITAGIIVPLLILLIIGVSVYIFYRKKYPVRMIVGKEFSNFTNPLYIKTPNSVSVNMSPDLPKAKPHFSLVIEKPNPVASNGRINLGFENETDLKTLEGNGSDMCQLDGENIQLELRGMESYDGGNNENEHDEEETRRRGSRLSKNSITKDLTEEGNTAMESEGYKTLDTNRVIEETVKVPNSELKSEKEKTIQENEAAEKADDNSKNETDVEGNRTQATDEAVENSVQGEDKMTAKDEDNTVKENQETVSNEDGDNHITKQRTTSASQKTESSN